MSSIVEKLGYSDHGRNTGALTVFLRKNAIDFHSTGNKVKILETRQCLHCGKDFKVSLKDKKSSKQLTCSISCSSSYPDFKKRRVEGKLPNGATSYPIIAKQHGLTSCCICGESVVIDIHHLDEDKTNNSIDNLVPLCPTHHAYIHRGKLDLIMDQLVDYLDKRILP